MSEPSPIYIQFSARGTEQILHAFQTIEQAGIAAGKRSIALEKSLAASLAASATASGKARVAVAEAVERQVSTTRTKAAATAERAAAKAAAAEMREAKRSADAQIRLRESVATANGKFAAKQAADEIAARKRSAAEQARTTQALARTEARIHREILKDQITPGRRALSPLAPTSPHARLALIQGARNQSPEQRRATLQRVHELGGHHELYRSAYERESHEFDRDRSERAQQYADRVLTGTTTAARRTIDAGRTVAHAAFSLGGGFSIENALRDRVEEERLGALLANKAPGGARPTQEVLDKSRAIGIKTGFDPKDIIGAWGAFIDKAGADTKADFDAGGINAEFMAKYSKATGSDIREVADVAGKLRDANKDLQPQEMKQLLLDILQQGRSGSVDLPELIGSVKSFTKSAPYYAGNMADNQRVLLGMAQVVSPAGSPREGATALTNLSGDAVKHHTEVERFMGKDYFDSQHRLTKSADVFMGDIIEKTHGDLAKIQDMGSGKTVFTKQSQRAFMAALVPYSKAKQEALSEGKSEDEANRIGRKAYDKFVEGKIGKSYSEADLNKDFANVMASGAESFESAVREFKSVVGTELLPVMKEFLPIMRDLVGPTRDVLRALADLANWARSNPFKGALTVLTASIATEVLGSIARAKIGDLLKSAITSGMGGGAPVPGALPGAGASPGTPATTTTAAGGSAAGGGFALAGIMITLAGIANELDRVHNASTEGEAAGTKARDDLASGDPLRVAHGQSALKRAQGTYTTENRAAAYADTAGTIVDYAMGPGFITKALGDQVTEWAVHKSGGKTMSDRADDVYRSGAFLDVLSKGNANSGPVPTTADPKLLDEAVKQTAEAKKQSAALEKIADRLPANGNGTRAPAPAPYGPADPNHPSRGHAAPATPQRPNHNLR